MPLGRTKKSPGNNFKPSIDAPAVTYDPVFFELIFFCLGGTGNLGVNAPR
jgi:hypothetical protein